MLEKPPVARLADFNRLLATEVETGRVVQVGFQSLGSHALGKLRSDAYAIGKTVAVGAVGAWSRTVGYWTRAPWSGRRSLNGRAVVDGVVTNPLAHAVATALAVADCRNARRCPVRGDRPLPRQQDRRQRHLGGPDPHHAGLRVTCALTLCAPEVREPEIRIVGERGSATFAYTSDRVEFSADGEQRTDLTGRTDLVENLLAHRRDGVPLLVPLASTGAFMRVLGAVADAHEPVHVDPVAATGKARARTGGRSSPTWSSGSRRP